MLSFARYFTPYRSMIGQLVLAMLVGSVIQMILPFLSQAMVDQGINGRNLNIIEKVTFPRLFIYEFPRENGCLRLQKNHS